MPRIIVSAESGSTNPVLLNERVKIMHLDDEVHSLKLLERIASALADAERVEDRPGDLLL